MDVHLEVDGSINVEQAHAISETARHRVLERHPVLDVLAHIDPAGHYLPGATPTH